MKNRYFVLSRLVLLAGSLLLGGLAWGQSARPGEVAAAPAAPAARPQPGLLAWGWYPPALNGQARGRADSAARPHVGLLHYQADAQGHLAGLPHDPAAQVAAAHRLSPGTPVLLHLRYQEAATGPSLFAPGQAQARQALADTLGQQLATTHADGLALAIGLRPLGPAEAPTTRRLRPGERQRVLGILNKQRLALNADSAKVKLAKTDIAWLQVRLRAVLSAAERAHYELLLRKRQQKISDFRQRLTAHRQSKTELGNSLFPKALLPPARPAPAGNEAGLQAFVRLLRQRLDAYRATARLAFTLPLNDSSRHDALLTSLLADVDFFLLPVADDALGRPGAPRQLSQLRAAVRRYHAAGVPANRLRVVFSHPGPEQARQAGQRPAVGRAHATKKPAAAPGPGRLPSWAHVALFAAALLLGFALGGGLLSALLRAPALIPFRQRLLRVGGLLGVGLLLLLGYGYFLGPADGRPLLYTCLVGLGLLGAGLLYHRYRQPAQLP